ncbi:MAG: DEAD/DEAH box helicase [Chloroflexota bacterium]
MSKRTPRQKTNPDLTPSPRAYFNGGTLVLADVDRNTDTPAPFEWIQDKWRCPAVHYRTVRSWLLKNQVRNTVPRWQNLKLTLEDTRDAHDYQTEAINTWHQADRWGSVVLPTGAGKTFVAIRAIADCQVSTLVIVPTLDLLHQWYACLTNAFNSEIGVWYGQEKRLEPITVTTYPSAWAQSEALGNQFKLMVFDEIHHLPAPTWHEIALMSAAPFRLGLTATYPEDMPDLPPERLAMKAIPNPSELLSELVGPVVYQKQIDDLTGLQLAEYRTERIRVDLTEEERTDYDTAYDTYTGYIRHARLRETHGAGWWDEFTRRSAYEAQARKAKVAELKLKDIVHQAWGKLEILDQLLREYHDQHILIFTAHNRFAYAIARRHLVPVITHQTKAAERKAILDGFQDGTYRVIVTSKVLNEGVDVPEAKVAIVLGGSANAREYVQRLGRILRKQGNARAVLFEVIARKTVDERIARQRRPVKYKVRG